MRTVIIADDHEVVLVGLESLLRLNDFQIIEVCKNGFELSKALERTKPDLLIVDFKMPGFGIDNLRAISADIPTVVLTSVTERPVLKSIAESGVLGVLTKESDKDEIMFCISTVLKGRKYITPEVLSLLFEPTQNLNGELEKLSKREIEILKLISEGYSNRQIGQILHLSSRTVDSHRSNILRKLKARNNQDLVKIALKHNLIDLN